MSRDYSFLDRAFHRIVLGNNVLGEVLGDLDGMLANSDGHSPDRHIYVTGLARAGTTTLMRALHGSGNFASLTYADMPMVMAPLLWARLSRPFAKERVKGERAHGDGILVDFDAPEAFEEVFWRIHCGKDYIRPYGLIPHIPKADAMDAYRAYVSRICERHGKSRYLAKNNNLMLRLDALRDAIPDATFLIVVRDPVAQATSLRSQHRRFAEADAFTRSYMTWLVHHEFGSDARPFRLPGQPVAGGDPKKLNHWLTLWIASYGWLLDIVKKTPNAFQVIVYEQLCNDPDVWERVAETCGLSLDTPVDFRLSQTLPHAEEADPDLQARGREIYHALSDLANT